MCRPPLPLCNVVHQRVLHAVLSITLSLAVMVLVAYAFAEVTRTEWVWWLAPLTVALDGSLLFRARSPGGVALLSPSELQIFRDPGTPIYLVSCVVGAGVAAVGAYIGNREAIIIGAAFAILGTAFERG